MKAGTAQILYMNLERDLAAFIGPELQTGPGEVTYIGIYTQLAEYGVWASGRLSNGHQNCERLW